MLVNIAGIEEEDVRRTGNAVRYGRILHLHHLSFYYDTEGVPSTEEISAYGFYGWYMEYTSTREDEIRKVLPDFERLVIARNTPVSGDIYAAPADSYEQIVTAFLISMCSSSEGTTCMMRRPTPMSPAPGRAVARRQQRVLWTQSGRQSLSSWILRSKANTRRPIHLS